MQRGGAWDNSDVKGAKKKAWLPSDKEYANGGFLKEQSVSIFGRGQGLDWTGTRGRTGPVISNKVGPNAKTSNGNAKNGVKINPAAKKGKKEEPEEKKKGLFGWF